MAAFPRPPMPILIVGITQTKALMLDLASPPASKRYKGGIATDPLLTTQRCDQRRCGITAKPTMLAGNRLGFHPVVRHVLPLCDGGGFGPPGARCIGASPRGSFYAQGSSAVQSALAIAGAIGVCPIVSGTNFAWGRERSGHAIDLCRN